MKMIKACPFGQAFFVQEDGVLGSRMGYFGKTSNVSILSKNMLNITSTIIYGDKNDVIPSRWRFCAVCV